MNINILKTKHFTSILLLIIVTEIIFSFTRQGWRDSKRHVNYEPADQIDPGDDRPERGA